MQYTIATGHSTEELIEEVNRLLLVGWETTGGLAISIPSSLSEGLLVEVKKDVLVSATGYGNNLIFCQALTKAP